MSDTEFFAAQTIKAGNPLRPYGVGRLIVGTVFLVCGLAVLGQGMSRLGEAVSAGNERFFESLDVVLLAGRSLVAVLITIGGIVMLSRGIGSLSRLIIPADAPRKVEPAEMRAALTRQEMRAYSLPRGLFWWPLRHWSPNQFALMTDRMRRLTSAGLWEVVRFVGVLILLILFFFGLASLPSEVREAMGDSAPGFPVLFLLLFALGAAAHLTVAILALPSSSPKASVREFRDSLGGGGDPSNLAHRLEHELDAIRPKERTPNRIHREGFKQEEGGVNDAGQFEGHLVVENQPKVLDSIPPVYLYLLLAFGALLQLAALGWWLPVPELENPTAPKLPEAMLLYGWLASLLGGVFLFRMGARMTRSARMVLGTFRFSSLGIVLDVKGNYARSQVRVGKGIHDSIETESLVVRSDISLTGYVATLLTESLGLTGPRAVVAMVVDKRVDEVERLVKNLLANFQQQGATIVGVNLQDQKLRDVVEANLVLDGQRAQTRALAGSSSAARLEASPPAGELPPGSVETDLRGQEDPDRL